MFTLEHVGISDFHCIRHKHGGDNWQIRRELVDRFQLQQNPPFQWRIICVYVLHTETWAGHEHHTCLETALGSVWLLLVLWRDLSEGIFQCDLSISRVWVSAPVTRQGDRILCHRKLTQSINGQGPLQLTATHWALCSHKGMAFYKLFGALPSAGRVMTSFYKCQCWLYDMDFTWLLNC